MNEYVKQTIEARKNAIFSSFEVDEKSKAKAEKLFTEIEEFGAGYDDVAKFEADFAASPLNQKFMDLFMEISMSAGKAGITSGAKGAAEAIADRVTGGVTNRVKQVVSPSKAAIHQMKYDAARKVPILGDALHIKNQVDTAKHFGKLFGIGKKKEK